MNERENLINLDDYEFVDEIAPQEVSDKSYSFFKSPVPKSKTNILQDIARVGARGLESAVGGTGDIASLGLDVGNYLAPGIVPKSKDVPLPTTEKARKVTKSLTGEYLEPKTELQETGDKFVEDLASFMLPAGVAGKIGILGKGAKSLGMGLGSAAKLSALRGVGGEAAKMLGASKDEQELAKAALTLGTMFVGNERFFTKKYEDLYNKAQKAIPEGAMHNASKLEDTVNKVYKYATSGDSSTDVKKFLKDKASVVGKTITSGKNPQINVNEVWELKKDLNKIYRSAPLDKEGYKYFNSLIDGLKDTLVNYGKVNKAFGKSFVPAESIYAGLRGSGQVTQFLKDNFELKNLFKNKTMKAIIGGGSYFQAGGIPTAAAVGTGYGITQGAKIADFLAKSPEARKYYSGVLKNSLAGNVSATAKDLSNLKKVAERYEKNNPQEEFINLDEYEFV